MPEVNGGPTLGEVARRLEEAIREMRDTRREMSDSQARSETVFLRKAEYALAQQTDASVIRGVENEMHSLHKRLDALDLSMKTAIREFGEELKRIEERRRTDRMWLVGGLAFPIILMLVAAVVLGTGVS